MVALPVTSTPANGVFRPLEANSSGSMVHDMSGSITVMSAGRPISRRPIPCLLETHQTSWFDGEQGDEPRPVDVPAVDQRLGVQAQRAVQSDDSEGSVLEVRVLLLVGVRGVVRREHRERSIRDRTRAGPRRLQWSSVGGFILAEVSYPSQASSVRRRWWGEASPLAASPRACACLRISTVPADDTCCTW